MTDLKPVLETATDGTRTWVFPGGRTLPFIGGGDGTGGAPDPSPAPAPSTDPAPTPAPAPTTDPAPSPAPTTTVDPAVKAAQDAAAAAEKRAKAAEAEAEKLRQKDMSDLEKAQAAAAKAAEQLTSMRVSTDKTEVKAAAAAAGAKHPGDAFSLIDHSQFERDDDGNITNAAALVAALIESERLPQAVAPASGPTANSGSIANPPAPGPSGVWTEDQLDKLTVDQVAALWPKIQANYNNGGSN